MKLHVHIFAHQMSQQLLKRIIGIFDQQLPGPLIILTGAMHGNEPAGVRALENVLDALESAQKDHSGFTFRGRLVALTGNTQAFLKRQRFLEKDLNRMWTPENIESFSRIDASPPQAEFLELQSLYSVIRHEIDTYPSKKQVFLDLHTTSAEGGVFSIPTDEQKSLELAKHLGAPAIVGLQHNIPGTYLGFASLGGFGSNSGVQQEKPICIAFEAGQHESSCAVNRAFIAVMRCLRALECLSDATWPELSDACNPPQGSMIPAVVRFQYAHAIKSGTAFKMRPGYVNFQPVARGEHLADDINGPIYSPEEGLILMPLYQTKGSDGFFIVR